MALFALSVLGASAEAQVPDLAYAEAHLDVEADLDHAAAHHSDRHPEPVGNAEEQESEHDHPDHGCDGCTCVAAAGCSGTALFPVTVSPTGPLETSSSVLRWSGSVAINPLGHDIFRPPRS